MRSFMRCEYRFFWGREKVRRRHFWVWMVISVCWVCKCVFVSWGGPKVFFVEPIFTQAFILHCLLSQLGLLFFWSIKRERDTKVRLASSPNLPKKWPPSRLLRRKNSLPSSFLLSPPSGQPPIQKCLSQMKRTLKKHIYIQPLLRVKRTEEDEKGRRKEDFRIKLTCTLGGDLLNRSDTLQNGNRESGEVVWFT